MLAIHPVRLLRRIPLVVLSGLLLVAAGGIVDVVVHLGPAHFHGSGGIDEHGAHLMGIAGMVLVLAGVVTHGVRRQRRSRGPQHGGLDRNAFR